jgi:hypothetical protein
MFKLLVPIDAKIIPRIRSRSARHSADSIPSTSLFLSAPSMQRNTGNLSSFWVANERILI